MKRKLLFVLLVFISLAPTHAQVWTPLEMHGGGKVTGIIGHPTDENIVYCRTDVAGIYKSTNKGNEWEQLLMNVPKYSHHISKVRSFAINPTNANEMFFASGNSPSGDHSGIWKSTDGGNSWQLKSELAAFSGNGIYRWADEVMVYKPSNTNMLFVGAQPKVVNGIAQKGGIFWTNDSGENWAKLNLSVFDDQWITKLIFDPDNDDILFIAAAQSNIDGLSSGGGLWSYVLSSQTLTSLTSLEVVDIDFDAVDKNKMLTVGPAGISISINKGVEWSVPSKPFGHTYTSFVTPHPTETNHWFFGAAQGFFSNGFTETTDGLATTQFTTYGNPNSSNYNRITWPPYAATNTNTQPVFGGSLSNFYFHEVNPSTAYFNNVWRCDNAVGALIDPTNNNENTNANWNWTFKAKGIYIMVGIRTSPHPTNSDTYTLNVADVNQYETLDNGGDMLYYGLMEKMNYSAVTIYSESNTNIRYSGGADNQNHGTLNKTTDGGITWNEISSPFFDGSKVIQDIRVDPTNPNVILVGIENSSLPSQVYKSTNGGASWNAWDSGLGAQLFFKKWEGWSRLMQDSDGETYYLWNSNKLFKRKINDASWNEISLPLNTPIRRVSIAKNKPGSLYVVYNQSNELYISQNYGTSWNGYALPYNNDSEFVSASPNGKVIVARRSNFTSKREFAVWINDNVENGEPWVSLSLNQHPTTIKNMTFINESRVVSMSHNQGSYRTQLSTAPGVVLTLKVMLQGPYIADNNLMYDGLRLGGFLPLTEPYSALGYDVESAVISQSLLNQTGNNALVDWLLVALRDAANPSIVLQSKAVLVQRDGTVVDSDGNHTIEFESVNTAEVEIAVRHRNHFGIRTAMNLSTNQPIDIDFTDPDTPLFGVNATKIINNKALMIAGNANSDGQINVVDAAIFRIQNGGAFSYINSTADFSLNGVINTLDKNKLWRPNNTKVEQLD